MARNESAPGAAQPAAAVELEDRAEALQAKATEHRIPLGLWALFGGLVAWAIYYFAAYVAWDQASELQAGGAVTTNIAHTVAYTAIPAAVIVALALAMARRKRG